MSNCKKVYLIFASAVLFCVTLAVALGATDSVDADFGPMMKSGAPSPATSPIHTPLPLSPLPPSSYPTPHWNTAFENTDLIEAVDDDMCMSHRILSPITPPPPHAASPLIPIHPHARRGGPVGVHERPMSFSYARRQLFPEDDMLDIRRPLRFDEPLSMRDLGELLIMRQLEERY